VFDFDLSKVPVEIAKLLMTHVTGIRPLQWQQERNPLAKKLLDEGCEATLFGAFPVKNEDMGSAVKSLLLLWGGWPGDANMLAQLAGSTEQLYIGVLCERQLGHSDRAKELLQEMAGHPIYPQLAKYTLKISRTGTDAAIQRFRKLIEFNQEWEPYAFIDFYEQARLGNLLPTIRDLVSDLQTKEFELLFGYCYEGATGQSIAKRRVLSEEEEKKRQEDYKRRLAERRMNPPRTSKTRLTPQPTSKKSNTAQPETKVKVLCPRCETTAFVPAAARGKKIKCLSCEAVFLVPTKKQTVVRQISGKK